MRKDRLIFISFIVSVSINILLWILLFSKFGFTSEFVPLHFNVVYGIDFVSKGYLVYQIPLVGLVVLLLNTWLAQVFKGTEILFSYFLSYGGVAVQLLLFVAGILLIIINK